SGLVSSWKSGAPRSNEALHQTGRPAARAVDSACLAGLDDAADRANALRILRRPPSLQACTEPRGIEAGVGQAGVPGSVLDEPVRNAELQHGYLYPRSHQRLADRRAGAAHHGV